MIMERREIRLALSLLSLVMLVGCRGRASAEGQPVVPPSGVAVLDVIRENCVLVRRSDSAACQICEDSCKQCAPSADCDQTIPDCDADACKGLVLSECVSCAAQPQTIPR